MDKKEELIKEENRKNEINGRKKIIKIVLLLKDVEVTEKEIEFLIKVNEKVIGGVFKSNTKVRKEIAEELNLSEIYVSKMLQKFTTLKIFDCVKKGEYKVDEKVRYAFLWDDLIINVKANGNFSIV